MFKVSSNGFIVLPDYRDGILGSFIIMRQNDFESNLDNFDKIEDLDETISWKSYTFYGLIKQDIGSGRYSNFGP